MPSSSISSSVTNRYKRREREREREKEIERERERDRERQRDDDTFQFVGEQKRIESIVREDRGAGHKLHS